MRRYDFENCGCGFCRLFVREERVLRRWEVEVRREERMEWCSWPDSDWRVRSFLSTALMLVMTLEIEVVSWDAMVDVALAMCSLLR